MTKQLIAEINKFIQSRPNEKARLTYVTSIDRGWGTQGLYSISYPGTLVELFITYEWALFGGLDVCVHHIGTNCNGRWNANCDRIKFSSWSKLSRLVNSLVKAKERESDTSYKALREQDAKHAVSILQKANQND